MNFLHLFIFPLHFLLLLTILSIIIFLLRAFVSLSLPLFHSFAILLCDCSYFNIFTFQHICSLFSLVSYFSFYSFLLYSYFTLLSFSLSFSSHVLLLFYSLFYYLLPYGTSLFILFPLSTIFVFFLYLHNFHCNLYVLSIL